MCVFYKWVENFGLLLTGRVWMSNVQAVQSFNLLKVDKRHEEYLIYKISGKLCEASEFLSELPNYKDEVRNSQSKPCDFPVSLQFELSSIALQMVTGSNSPAPKYDQIIKRK